MNTTQKLALLAKAKCRKKVRRKVPVKVPYKVPCLVPYEPTECKSYLLNELINEVRQRPILWNTNCADHRRKSKRRFFWKQVADALGSNSLSVMNRWRSIKYKFERELKNIEKVNGEEVYTGKWQYYHLVKFLKEIKETNFNIKNVHPIQINYIILKNNIGTCANEPEETQANENDEFFVLEDDADLEENISEEKPKIELKITISESELQISKPEIEFQINKPEIELQINKPANIEVPINKPEIEWQINKSANIEVRINEPKIDLQINKPEIKLQINKPEIELQTKTPEIELNFNSSNETSGLGQPASRSLSELMNVECDVKKVCTVGKKKEVGTFDEDLHYAVSLLPFLKKLDPIKKLKVRTDIQSLLFNRLRDN